jgi:hypothetical protein
MITLQVPSRRALLALVLACASLAAGADGGFILVSPEEFQLEKDAQNLVTRGAQAPDIGEPESKRAADGPVIEIMTPDARQPVKAPVDIVVNFRPGPDARIVLDTLRIRYGMIGLDVTERIRKAATVTEQGIRASGAELPAGRHSMSVEISDSAGRTTKQAFKFRVEA